MKALTIFTLAASATALHHPALRTAPLHAPAIAPKIARTPNVKANVMDKPVVRGSLVVTGGFLAHFILGTMYCWGNYLAYAPTSLLFFDGLPHPGMTPDAVQVMPFALVALNIGLPVGARTNRKFGPRFTTMLGCAMMVLGTYLGSFQTRLLPFMLYYSLLAGFGTGLSYSTPMQAGWTWFPEKKGLINGLTLMGFGAGAFIFNKVGTNFALGGLPWSPMLRKLACIYAIISLGGSAMIKAKPVPTVPELYPPPEVLEEECEVDEPTMAVAVTPPEACDPPGAEPMQAFTSRRFALMWLLGLMTFTPGLTVLGLYKRFGMTSGGLIADDRLQSAIGGLGALANGAGRVFWGNLVDRIGFFKGFAMTGLLSISMMLALPLTVNSKTAFAGAVCGSLFCLGGSIAMFVTANAQIFGTRNAGEIYSVLFSAFALASIVGAKLTMALVATVGWKGIFTILAGMGCTAVTLLRLLFVEKSKLAPWEVEE